jgi:hypothetical protein
MGKLLEGFGHGFECFLEKMPSTGPNCLSWWILVQEHSINTYLTGHKRDECMELMIVLAGGVNQCTDLLTHGHCVFMCDHCRRLECSLLASVCFTFVLGLFGLLWLTFAVCKQPWLWPCERNAMLIDQRTNLMNHHHWTSALDLWIIFSNLSQLKYCSSWWKGN